MEKFKKKDEFISSILKVEQIKFNFQDTVKVSFGPLKNLLGKVIKNNINSEGKTIVTIMPQCKGLNEPLDFESTILKKFFFIGEQVKVLFGPFKGETGLIVKIDEEKDILFIFSDITSKEIQVKINLVTETNEVSRGRNWFNQYNLHDLVQLNTCDTFGMITQVQKRQFTVLNKSNDLQIIRLNEIIRKIDDRQTVALDKNFDQIQVGDIVLPLTGQFHGERCTVKHIFRISLFLHNRLCRKSGGIFVFIARQTILFNKIFNHLNECKSNLINDRQLMVNKKIKRDPFNGETVIIVKGQWKGYLGIVKATSDKHLQIELHAKCKTINIRRKNVKKHMLKDKYLKNKVHPMTQKTMYSNSLNKNKISKNLSTLRYNIIKKSTIVYHMLSHKFMTPKYDKKVDRLKKANYVHSEQRKFNKKFVLYCKQNPFYKLSKYKYVIPIYQPIQNEFSLIKYFLNFPYTPYLGSLYKTNLFNKTKNIDTNLSQTSLISNNIVKNNSLIKRYHFFVKKKMTNLVHDMTIITKKYRIDEKYINYKIKNNKKLNENIVNNSEYKDLTKINSTNGNSINDISGKNIKNKNLHYYITYNSELLYKNKIVIVKKIFTDTVKIILGGKEIFVKKKQLVYKNPNEGDVVKIVSGKDLGEKGRLLGIDGNDAIVKMKRTSEIQILSINTLVKITTKDITVD